MFGSTSIEDVDVKTFGGKMMSKTNVVTSNTDVMMSKRRLDVMHESLLIPPHVRQHFLAPVQFTEILVEFARISLSVDYCPIFNLMQNPNGVSNYLEDHLNILTQSCLPASAEMTSPRTWQDRPCFLLATAPLLADQAYHQDYDWNIT